MFDQNPGLTRLEIRTLSHYVKMTFLYPRQPFFSIQNVIRHHVQVFLKENETEKNFQIFDENHELLPLEKWTFSQYVKMTFLQSRKCFFFSFRIHLNIMCRSIPKKMRLRRNVLFLTKIKGQPLMKNGHFHTMLD